VSVHFDIGGRRFHYFSSGHGPVAVLVHGFPLDARLWLDQIEGLAPYRTVVAVDLRGCGRSDPVGSGPLSMETHADDLAAIVAAVGVDAVDLVGLSMGGYVALAFAQRHPEMLRTLALVDTKATADTDAARAGRDAMAERVVVDGRRALAGEMVGALLSQGAALGVRARLRTMIEATSYETILGCLAGMKLRADRTSVLATIGVPTAVIVGEEDRLTTPEDAHTMATGIPGATLRVISGAGHLAPMEAPDSVNDVLAELWLSAGEATAR
jgi:pimeloyl-ACP methyl ester carboxylesterase